jgi:hypothetical protein
MPEGMTNLQEKEVPAKTRGMKDLLTVDPLTFGAEELLHQGGALVCQDAAGEGGFWVERPGACHGDACLPDTVRPGPLPAIRNHPSPVPVLFVFGAVYYPPDLAPIECAGAHETGLYRYIDGCARQVFASQMIEGGGEGDDLGVGRAVGETFCLVMSPGNDLVVEDDDGADRHFVFGICLTGFF